MITIWLKAIHVAGLVVWCAGILLLPALFARRMEVGSKSELWQVQRYTWYTYRAVVSPAAFVTVVSGIALVFVREAFTAWFAAKLLAVGLLAILHIRFGHIILRLFENKARYQSWRKWLSLLGAIVVISAILVLVLYKPHLSTAQLPTWLRQPGGLRDLLLPLVQPLLQSLPDTIRPIP